MRAAAPSRRNLLAGGLLALAAPACGPLDAGLLRAAETHPPGYPTTAALEEFGRLLAERSDGRLRLQLYAGGQLGEEKDTLEITIFGGLDLNRVNLAPLNAFAPLTIPPTLPFLFRSIAHMRAAMDGAPGKQILASLEPHGLIGLCFYDSGARSIYTTRRPVLRPADLAGQKIRVMNSDVAVALVEALGADAAPVPYGEVYQGLLQGLVDGAENNLPSFESSRHFEAARYYSLTQHTMAPEVLVASARTWRKLAPEQRALVRQCAADSVVLMRRLWDARTAAAEAKIRAAGVTVLTPDPAPFAARARGVWERFLTTPASKQLVADILAVEVRGV